MDTMSRRRRARQRGQRSRDGELPMARWPRDAGEARGQERRGRYTFRSFGAVSLHDTHGCAQEVSRREWRRRHR